MLRVGQYRSGQVRCDAVVTYLCGVCGDCQNNPSVASSSHGLVVPHERPVVKCGPVMR
jgi:hypothetical protein